MIRLDKYLAECGVGTRSEVKKMIRANRIRINDLPATKPEQKVSEETDIVTVNGQQIQYEKYGYYLFHKPAGCVTATKDNLHKTVMDFFPEECRGYAPVGRLDIDTEGLLLITNDGALAHHLISPSHHIPKTYYVELDAPLEDSVCAAFEKGVDIGDDTLTKPAELVIGSDPKTAEITIYEGRFHQVKRMFQAVDRSVLYLKRIAMGTVTLGDLPKGTYRKLTTEEVQGLQK